MSRRILRLPSRNFVIGASILLFLVCWGLLHKIVFPILTVEYSSHPGKMIIKDEEALVLSRGDIERIELSALNRESLTPTRLSTNNRVNEFAISENILITASVGIGIEVYDISDYEKIELLQFLPINQDSSVSPILIEDELVIITESTKETIGNSMGFSPILFRIADRKLEKIYDLGLIGEPLLLKYPYLLVEWPISEPSNAFRKLVAIYDISSNVEPVRLAIIPQAESHINDVIWEENRLFLATYDNLLVYRTDNLNDIKLIQKIDTTMLYAIEKYNGCLFLLTHNRFYGYVPDDSGTYRRFLEGLGIIVNVASNIVIFEDLVIFTTSREIEVFELPKCDSQ